MQTAGPWGRQEGLAGVRRSTDTGTDAERRRARQGVNTAGVK